MLQAWSSAPPGWPCAKICGPADALGALARTVLPRQLQPRPAVPRAGARHHHAHCCCCALSAGTHAPARMPPVCFARHCGVLYFGQLMRMKTGFTIHERLALSCSCPGHRSVICPTSAGPQHRAAVQGRLRGPTQLAHHPAARTGHCLQNLRDRTGSRTTDTCSPALHSRPPRVIARRCAGLRPAAAPPARPAPCACAAARAAASPSTT
jgi:hypothetical protein